MSGDYNQIFKIILVGDSGVGKTNIISRFVDDEFRLSTKSTIGVEFAHVDVKIKNDTVKLQIWDTAGQERFRAVIGAYYRGALGIILVYDITKQKSFNNIVDFWIKEVKQHCCTCGTCDNCRMKKNNEKICLILVGNKCDASDRREITTETGKQFAQQNNMTFFETSAMESININDVFINIANQILKNSSDADEKNNRDLNYGEDIKLRTYGKVIPIDDAKANNISAKNVNNNNCKC